MTPMFECNLPPYLSHDLAAIITFIDGVPFLSDLQRSFYKVYLAARYEALFAQQKNSKHSYAVATVSTERILT